MEPFMRYRGLVFLFFIPVFALAVTPQFWEDFSQSDLLQGRLDRVSLSSEGKLFLAPAYDLFFDTSQPYIFSMVRDKAGNIYVGTGIEGKVFKVDPSGKGALYFQSKELSIFSMALDSSDTLYVGTSPDGKVYKISGPNQASEFCDLDEKYIWAMVFDSANNLYIGTGASGVIYKVDKGGKKSAFYTCPDNNDVSLLMESNNNLLAGTSPGGLLIEITPDGKGFTLLDTPLEEVHAISADRFGTIYAVASASRDLPKTPQNKAKPASGSSAIASTATVTIESAISLAGKSEEAKAATIAPTGEKSISFKSAVYAIARDGSSEVVYESNDQMAFDALVRDDGSLLIATGPKGRLLSIDAAKQMTVVSDSPEEDLTRLLPAGDVTFVAGSNQGKIYRLQSQRAQSGAFESRTLDAKTVASWGKLSWRMAGAAGTSVEISTRTGNTEKADRSWSSWSNPYSAAGQQISSPRARYLQWRAVFKRNSAAQASSPDALDQVQIAYLQQNLRPQVSRIEVLPSGIELQKQSSLALGISTFTAQATAPDGRSLNAPREHGRETQPLLPRQVLQPGAQSFTWKASDENQDSLEYSLFFKGEGESEWKLLEKKFTETFYTLNAASLPDGVYRMKVVASDAPSNPYNKFLVGELISEPFVIANTSPQVEMVGNKVNGKRIEAQYRVRVSAGNIATSEFSIDGGDWNLISPVDGIADSAQEEYKFTTWDLSPGEHLVGIRASDRNGNTGTAKLVVKIQ
jgi:hypothetical protein